MKKIIITPDIRILHIHNADIIATSNPTSAVNQYSEEEDMVQIRHSVFED